MTGKNIMVTKASGAEDNYSEEKLRRSLSRSGASEKTINAILSRVNSKLYNRIPTKKIYKLAFRLLKKNAHVEAARYNLKRAIMELGPSGFPFEQYISAIFEWQGYNTMTKQFLKGVCVTHEIDVFAEKNNHSLMIECKYHNNPGGMSDVKVPLYIYSRYRDVLNEWEKAFPGKSLEGWVVTNTKFSSDAVKYGLCAGLKLLGWNYPPEKNLNRLVDEAGLYPITCLTTLSGKEKERILAAGIVLCRDLAKQELLLKRIFITDARIPLILAEIGSLCKV